MEGIDNRELILDSETKINDKFKEYIITNDLTCADNIDVF